MLSLHCGARRRLCRLLKQAGSSLEQAGSSLKQAGNEGQQLRAGQRLTLVRRSCSTARPSGDSLMNCGAREKPAWVDWLRPTGCCWRAGAEPACQAALSMETTCSKQHAVIITAPAHLPVAGAVLHHQAYQRVLLRLAPCKLPPRLVGCKIWVWGSRQQVRHLSEAAKAGAERQTTGSGMTLCAGQPPCTAHRAWMPPRACTTQCKLQPPGAPVSGAAARASRPSCARECGACPSAGPAWQWRNDLQRALDR